MPDVNKEPQNLTRAGRAQPQSKDYKFIGSQRKYSRELVTGFTKNGDLDETRGVGKFRRKMNGSGVYTRKIVKVGRGKFPSRGEGYKGGV